MNLETLVFVFTLFMTFAVFQLLWDGQFLTYPMFRWLHQRDEMTFVHIHQTYVKNLGIPTYLPCVLYLIACALLLFIRPAYVPLPAALVINALNIIAVISTAVQLVPIHIQIDTDERASLQQVDLLLRYNTIRFGLVAVNSVILLIILAQLLAR
jgi:hypothetical protein